MVSVHRIGDVAGSEIHSVGCRGAAVLLHAWRMRDLNTVDARAAVPGHPKPTGYPAVEDVPPRSEKPSMTVDEQLKLKEDLTAARDRQVPKGKAKDEAKHVEPVKP